MIFWILHFICKVDYITFDPTYTSRIIVPVACLNILKVKIAFSCPGCQIQGTENWNVSSAKKLYGKKYAATTLSSSLFRTAFEVFQ